MGRRLRGLLVMNKHQRKEIIVIVRYIRSLRLRKPEHPQIDVWLKELLKLAGDPDANG